MFYRMTSFPVTLTLTKVSRSQCFSKVSQKWCILETKLLWDTNRKPKTGYRMLPVSDEFK